MSLPTAQTPVPRPSPTAFYDLPPTLPEQATFRELLDLLEAEHGNALSMQQREHRQAIKALQSENERLRLVLSSLKRNDTALSGFSDDSAPMEPTPRRPLAVPVHESTHESVGTAEDTEALAVPPSNQVAPLKASPSSGGIQSDPSTTSSWVPGRIMPGQWESTDGTFYAGVPIYISEEQWHPVNPPGEAHKGSAYTIRKVPGQTYWDLVETPADGQREPLHWRLEQVSARLVEVRCDEKGLRWTLIPISMKSFQRKARRRRTKPPSFVRMDTKSNIALAQVYQNMRHWKKATFDELRFTEKTHRYIIDPYSTGRVLWDLCAFLIISYQVLLVPVEFAFYEPGQTTRVAGSVWWWLELACFDFFLFDIVLNCITAYVQPSGVMIQNQWLILGHYLLSPPYLMLIDILSLVPTILALADAETQGVGVRVFRLLLLLRIIRGAMIVRYLSNMIIFSGRFITVAVEVSKLFICGCLITHLVACLWRAIAQFDRHAVSTSVGIDVSSVAQSYALSFWWTVITFTDSPPLPPTNAEEMILWALASFASVLLTGLGLAILVQRIDAFTEERKLFHWQMDIAHHFLNRHEMPEKVKTKVVSAVREAYVMEHRRGRFKKFVEPLLSRQLLYQIYGHIHSEAIERFPPFQGTDREEPKSENGEVDEEVMRRFRYQLAYEAKTAHYSPGDLILEEGRPGDSMIFLMEGKARLQSMMQMIPMTRVREGWWLEEHVLFWPLEDGSRPVRLCTCEAVLPCNTLEISLDKFWQVVRDFKLEGWANHMVQKSKRKEPWGCPMCGARDHWFKDCDANIRGSDSLEIKTSLSDAGGWGWRFKSRDAPAGRLSFYGSLRSA